MSCMDVVKRRKEYMKKKPMIIITVAIIAVVALIAGLLLVNRELELPELTAEDISKVYRDTFDDNKIEDRKSVV